jgi:GNAT superfamily N-acetyltransferase
MTPYRVEGRPQTMPDEWVIRPARPGEHGILNALALRSVQQVWDYSDAFMAWEPEAITIVPEHITGAITRVLEVAGRPVGVYVLRGDPPEIELSRLMIEPDHVGTGCGRRLWEDAVGTARDLGATAITLDADPNAEPFYRRMGAATTGELDWEPPMMPGWRVKTMRFEIPAQGQRDQAGAASSPEA